MGVSQLAGFTPPRGGSAVTLGAFDGVHAGHRALLELLQERARSQHLASVVATFDRHPAAIVRPDSAPKLLCDLAQKLELLEATGVDEVVVIPFDRERSQKEAEDFVSGILVGALGARVIAVGEDFHFGRERRGNVRLLREMGAELGFEVVHLELVRQPGGGGAVSSTAIRQVVVAGQVEAAAESLTRSYEVRGVVAEGAGRGRNLGFPTANVVVPEEILMPAPGIYAGRCVLPPDPEARAAAISLGVRPTFVRDGGGPLLLEAYLLDFDGDIYGREAHVRFVSRLRDEERFDDLDALVAQIGRDVAATRAVLGRRAS